MLPVPQNVDQQTAPVYAPGWRRVLALGATIHPFPVLVVMLTSLGMLLIAGHGRLSPGFLARAELVVLLSQIPVGSLNDYLDREADRLAGRNKPIATGVVP